MLPRRVERSPELRSAVDELVELPSGDSSTRFCGIPGNLAALCSIGMTEGVWAPAGDLSVGPTPALMARLSGATGGMGPGLLAAVLIALFYVIAIRRLKESVRYAVEKESHDLYQFDAYQEKVRQFGRTLPDRLMQRFFNSSLPPVDVCRGLFFAKGLFPDHRVVLVVHLVLFLTAQHSNEKLSGPLKLKSVRNF